MTDSDRVTDSTGLAPRGPAGKSRAAAWVASVVLVLVCVARWPGFTYESYLGGVIFQAGLLGLLLIAAFPGSASGARGMRRNPAVLFLGGYALLSGLSMLWAPQPRLAAVGSLTVLFAVGWALGLAQLLGNRRDVRRLLRAIFIAGTVAAIVGIYYVAARYFQPVGEASGLERLRAALSAIERVQGHRNFLAIFLLPPILLGAADLLGPFLVKGSPRRSVLGWPAGCVIPCLLAMLAALAMCKAIGAGLGLVAGAGCLVASRVSRRTRILAVTCAVALVVISVAVLSHPAMKPSLMESPQATRWYMWQGAVRMIGKFPLLGWGTGMFMPYFADFKPTDPMRHGWLTSVTLHPHNELLLVAVEVGVIGLALYVGGLFSAVRAGARAAARESDPRYRLAGGAVVAGFVAMFVHGLVSVALRFWAPGPLYWTLAGVLIALPRIGRAERVAAEPDQKRAGAWIVGAVRFLVALVGVAVVAHKVVWPGAWAEWQLRGGLDPGSPVAQTSPARWAWSEFLFEGKWRPRPLTDEEYLAQHEKAAFNSRYVPDYILALKRRALRLDEMKDGTDRAIAAAIAAFERLEATIPGYGPTRKRLGGLYFQRAVESDRRSPAGREADMKRAVELLNLAVRQNPYDADAQLTLARSLRTASERNVEAAIRHVEKAIESTRIGSSARPLAAEAHTLLAALLSDMGRREEALNALNRARELVEERHEARMERIRRSRERILRNPDTGAMERLDDMAAAYERERLRQLKHIDQVQGRLR